MKYVAVLLASLVVVLGVHSISRADAPAGVTKWEYKVERGTAFDEMTEPLNKAGADGWEVCGVGVGGRIKNILLKAPREV